MPTSGRVGLARATVGNDRSSQSSSPTTVLWSRGAERLDLAAAVGLAVRAHPVGLLGPAALRAGVHARRLDAVVRAPLVPARLGGFFLGDGHWRASIAVRLAQPRGSPEPGTVPGSWPEGTWVVSQERDDLSIVAARVRRTAIIGSGAVPEARKSLLDASGYPCAEAARQRPADSAPRRRLRAGP